MSMPGCSCQRGPVHLPECELVQATWQARLADLALITEALAEARTKALDEAIAAIERAAEAEDDNARYSGMVSAVAIILGLKERQ